GGKFSTCPPRLSPTRPIGNRPPQDHHDRPHHHASAISHTTNASSSHSSHPVSSLLSRSAPVNGAPSSPAVTCRHSKPTFSLISRDDSGVSLSVSRTSGATANSGLFSSGSASAGTR